MNALEVSMDWDELNKCLRGELGSVETYQQALERDRQRFGHEVEFQKLSDILKDHQEAASQLQAQIQGMGGTPTQDSGAWGTWAKTVMGGAKLLGDKAALKALKEGEESGAKEYQDILTNPATPAEVKSLISILLLKQQAHIQELDRLIETA